MGRLSKLLRRLLITPIAYLALSSPFASAYSHNLVSSPIHTLILCRHGDSVWNGGEINGSPERFTGWTDVDLSDKGRTEALAASEQVASYSYEIDACFTSSLRRAQRTATACLNEIGYARKRQPRTIVDHRLNERHYGSLQGYIKREVEEGIYGHDPEDVRLWRRSWDVIPPPLQDGDPRRVHDVQRYAHLCGGADKVPRSESLAMVAKNRVRPFLDKIMTPLLDRAAWAKGQKDGSTKRRRQGVFAAPFGSATGLVVAHANSLRALIGVVCEVENDPAALRILEALRIPTGVPLVLKYQRTPANTYQVADIPEAEECIVEYMDGPGPPQEAPVDLGHPKLPVWPLNQCIPIQDIFSEGGPVLVHQKQQQQYFPVEAVREEELVVGARR